VPMVRSGGRLSLQRPVRSRLRLMRRVVIQQLCRSIDFDAKGVDTASARARNGDDSGRRYLRALPNELGLMVRGEDIPSGMVTSA